MSNKSDNSAVALATDKGDSTPLVINPFAVSANQANDFLQHIDAAQKAKPEDFTDITPVYWEAKRGEVQTMVFLGWKRTVKVDEKTGEELSEKYFAVFHDGKRQIVAGQLALLEAMFGRPQNVVYKITCEESVAGKAKKFLVEQFNG